MDLLGTIGQIGEGVDKFTGGRALRGLAAGKPRELASVLPFSDSTGITNPGDKTSGRDLTDMYGVTRRGDNSFGSHALGFAADTVLSPGNLLGGYGAFKAAPTLAKGVVAGGKALSGLDLFDHLASGARGLKNFATRDAGSLGLKYDRTPDLYPGQTGLPNGTASHHFGLAPNDPEWVNNRTFYHGTAAPNLSASSLNPMNTDPGSLYGRGIYATDEGGRAGNEITGGYAGARYDTAIGEHTALLNQIRSYAPEFEAARARHGNALLGALRVPENLESLKSFGEDLPESPGRALGMWHDWINDGGSGNATANRWLRGLGEPIERAAGYPTDQALLAKYAGLDPATLPAKTIYQSQSNFGKILDLDGPASSDLEEASRAMTGRSGEPKGGHTAKRLVALARDASINRGVTYPDPLIKMLKGDLGYDALTHIGGERTGKMAHQVVIGLDPNDKYGLGRSTPHSIWEAIKNFGAGDAGSLSLKFDGAAAPPGGMLRSDPDWINNRTAYHGTATPGIAAASLDPRKTDPDGLFGRGVYTTDNPDLASTYSRNRMFSAQQKFHDLFNPRNTRSLIASGKFPDDLVSLIQGAGQSLANLNAPSLEYHVHNAGQQIAKWGPDQRPVHRRLYDLYSSEFGHQPIPSPTLYQGQSSFNKILDLDVPPTSDLMDATRSLNSKLEGYNDFNNNPHFAPGVPGSHFVSAAKSASMDYGDSDPDQLVKMLKGDLGYDALTHTGGIRAGRGKLLHQVTIGLDPNDKYGLGRSTPYSIWEAMKNFGGGESGYLRHRIPGVSDEMHDMMDGLGPQYPGGVNKLLLPEDAMSVGSATSHDNETLAQRISKVAYGPHGEQVASELPEGSRFLGAGFEGIAYRTPDGSVIRIGDRPDQAVRPDIPEMLQAYRETHAGPYKIEHMPEVADVGDEHGATLNRMLVDNHSDELENAVTANARVRRLNEQAAKHLSKSVDQQGLWPWDVSSHNVGMTPEGNSIIFDGGAVMPRAGETGFDARMAPKQTYEPPTGNRLAEALAAGGPEKVRESLRTGNHMGTVGQGVMTPHMAELAAQRELVQDYLSFNGVNPGMRAGWRGDTPAYAYAAPVSDSSSPSLAKLAAYAGGSLGGGGLLAALASQQQGQ